MAPQPTRGLMVVALVAACAGKNLPTGFAEQAEQREAQRRCEEGSAAACGTLGRILTEGKDSGRDYERGLVLLEVACGQDDQPACVVLSGRYAHYSRDPHALARAHDLAARSCERGFATGCTMLGEVIKYGEGGDSNAASAAFRKGCELGDARGCELAGMMEYERGNLSDPAADRMLAQACSLGRLASCHYMALALAGKRETHAQGVSLLEKTCKRGYGLSCFSTAMLDAPVVSAHPDCTRALAFANEACRLGATAGCTTSDACKLEDPREAQAALERLRAGCGQKEPLACLYWADRESRREPAADPDPILRAYQLACRRGASDPASMVGCARLAMTELGLARSQIQADTAIAQLRRECERSSREACCYLGEQYREGKWVPADTEKAQDLRTRACNLGCDRCCSPRRPPTEHGD